MLSINEQESNESCNSFYDYGHFLLPVRTPLVAQAEGSRKFASNRKKSLIFKLCSFFTFLLTWIAVFIVSFPDIENNIVYSISTYGIWKSRSFKIILFGDSLINIPCTYYNLPEKLQHQFPHFPLTIINAGINGNKIADMKSRVYSDVVEKNPDAVMILWDSDVSDQSIEVLAEQSTQLQFEANCMSVFLTCSNASKFVSVAGPVILSEGPIFATDEYNKFDTLNEYRTLVRNISSTYGIPYVDLRGSFMSSIPASWQLSRFYLTADGEHENQRGVRILAREFGKVINNWLVEGSPVTKGAHEDI